MGNAPLKLRKFGLVSEQLVDSEGRTNTISRNYTDTGYLGRSAGFSLAMDGVINYAVTYGYNGDGRFAQINSTIAGQTNFTRYNYLPNSGLLTGYSITNSAGQNLMTQRKSYESHRNLITEIQHSAGNNQISAYSYLNDEIGRRTRREDSFIGVASVKTNQFGYNLRSEVTNAVMAADSAMPSEFAYLYDNLGNRITASEPTALATSYAANELNQYSSITNDGSAVALEYDLDGNLLSDGTWHYSWNGENRLIQVTNATTALTFAYDFQGRRHQKVTQTFLSAPTVTTNTYVYDGWNLIAEVGRGVPSAPQSTTFHLRGLDLSGSLQGAGGVGGLLTTIKSNTSYLTTFDANGNVSDYVDSTANVAAHYEYGPFGAITSTGTNSENSSFRFSTKYQDDETGLYYYGYRYYSADLDRWLNRDPIAERGGLNIYSFISNRSINDIDNLGLVKVCDWVPHTKYFCNEYGGAPVFCTPRPGASSCRCPSGWFSGNFVDYEWECTGEDDPEDDEDNGSGIGNVIPFIVNAIDIGTNGKWLAANGILKTVDNGMTIYKIMYVKQCFKFIAAYRDFWDDAIAGTCLPENDDSLDECDQLMQISKWCTSHF